MTDSDFDAEFRDEAGAREMLGVFLIILVSVASACALARLLGIV